MIPLLSSAPLESLMLKNPLFNRPILQQRSFVSAEYQERMQKSLTMRMMPSKSSFTRFGQNRLEAELARPSPPHRVIAPPPLPSSAATLNIERLAQIRNSYGIIKYQGTTIKSPPIIYQASTRAIPFGNIPASDILVEPHNLDGVVVLAYVCKRLPKAPNPAKTLVWNA